MTARIIECILGKKDYFVLVLSAAVVTALLLPGLDTPLFWDEFGYQNSVSTIVGNGYNPFIEYLGYRPPGMLLLAAGFRWVIGELRVAERVLVLMATILALWYIYLLGKSRFSAGIGIVTAVLVFLIPVFRAESGLFDDSIFVTMLVLALVYHSGSNKLWPAFLPAACLVLTKETSVVILLADLVTRLGLYGYRGYFARPKVRDVDNLRKILFIDLLPLGIFCLWMILNWIFLGWVLWPTSAAFFTSLPSFTEAIQITLKILSWIFFDQARYFLTLGLVTGLVGSLWSRKLGECFKRQELLFFIVLLFATICFFVLQGEHRFQGVLPRYYLYLFPYSVLFSVVGFHYILRFPSIRITGFTGIALVFFHHWNVSEAQNGESTNLTYRDMVECHLEVVAYLGANDPDKTVISIWPLIGALSDPLSGYNSVFSNRSIELEQYARARFEDQSKTLSDRLYDPLYKRDKELTIDELILAQPNLDAGPNEKSVRSYLERISAHPDVLFRRGLNEVALYRFPLEKKEGSVRSRKYSALPHDGISNCSTEIFSSRDFLGGEDLVELGLHESSGDDRDDPRTKTILFFRIPGVNALKIPVYGHADNLALDQPLFLVEHDRVERGFNLGRIGRHDKQGTWAVVDLPNVESVDMYGDITIDLAGLAKRFRLDASKKMSIRLGGVPLLVYRPTLTNIAGRPVLFESTGISRFRFSSPSPSRIFTLQSEKNERVIGSITAPSFGPERPVLVSSCNGDLPVRGSRGQGRDDGITPHRGEKEAEVEEKTVSVVSWYGHLKGPANAQHIQLDLNFRQAFSAGFLLPEGEFLWQLTGLESEGAAMKIKIAVSVNGRSSELARGYPDDFLRPQRIVNTDRERIRLFVSILDEEKSGQSNRSKISFRSCEFTKIR